MFRSSKSWRVLAVTAAAALALSACGSDDSDGSSSGDGGDAASYTLAFLGPQTGDAGNLGINISNGAQLAVDEFNAAHDDIKVDLKIFDSQGNPDQATPLAQEIIGNDAIIGVVGPAFSGESASTGPAFNEAGLVTVSASATNPDLTKNGWTTFHRVLGTDAVQAPAAAKLITGTIGAKKVFIVDDAQEYSVGIADGVKAALGSAVVGTDEGQKGQKDWSATVTKIKDSGADAVFYGGYYTEAGLLKKAIDDAGLDISFVSGDGSLDPGFIESAGGATDKVWLTCPCFSTAQGDFAEKYKAKFNTDPGTYSPEAYDAASVLLNGIAAGKTDRASLLDYVNAYDEDGLTKHIKFDNGEVSDQAVYSYTVDGGKISEPTPID